MRQGAFANQWMPAGHRFRRWTDPIYRLTTSRVMRLVSGMQASLSGEVNETRNRVPRFTIGMATRTEREAIYGLRHQVYADELKQHPVNDRRKLRDTLDDHNVYLVARCESCIAGFISITPPAAGSYSVEKYFRREECPFPFDERLYEIRLLTVLKAHRGNPLAMLLMYAAFRWVQAHGGTHLTALGRNEVLQLYHRVGLRSFNLQISAGAVRYDLMHAEVAAMQRRVEEFSALFEQIEQRTEWKLPFGFRKASACFHGGAFFSAIGSKFDALENRDRVINADVLDAWFPPSPRVLSALQEHLPWLLRTSPPTNCEGLIEAIAQARGIAPENILPGAGSSDLIFRALRHWLSPASHVLILDPTYGEYAHVLEKVIGCTVDRFTLSRSRNYDVELGRIQAALSDAYDLVVLVNPNSPTGRHIDHDELTAILRNAPPQTRFWIDETYIDYAGKGQSMEQFAARSENVVICKSMSKVYALSGARVAYLCAGPHQLESLRAITPPWVVSLPAQVAAVKALDDPTYYAERYRETSVLRLRLSTELAQLGWEVVPGIANFVLCHLPERGFTASTLNRHCQARGLFLRDASVMGSSLGHHALRIAVKDAATNQRILGILRSILKEQP